MTKKKKKEGRKKEAEAEHKEIAAGSEKDEDKYAREEVFYPVRRKTGEGMRKKRLFEIVLFAGVGRKEGFQSFFLRGSFSFSRIVIYEKEFLFCFFFVVSVFRMLIWLCLDS